MRTLSEKFTKWYCRKGYTIVWEPFTECGKDYIRYDAGVLIYNCPSWVKILAKYLFIPSVYFREKGMFSKP